MEIREDNLKPEDFRKIILNTHEPLVVQNIIKSDLISWNLENWKEMLKDELLKFRCGKYKYTIEPQWETTCSYKQATFEEFLDKIDLDDWWYFDYKYLCEYFTDKEVLKKKIDWSALGFPEATANESTIWIGSKGAHTPCHMDSYGCNVILQVYGRKQWILFPPEQNLKPTRIPFEESSIYSKINFFSPKEEDFKGLSNCRQVILNPGDVLVLPHRWWHYVENLDTAISINVWLPLPQDDLERIKESIATILVRQMVATEDGCEDIVLNPNMKEEMVTCGQALDIIMATVGKSKPRSKQTNKMFKASCSTTRKLDDECTKEIFKKCTSLSEIPILSDGEFKSFLQSRTRRFSNTEYCKKEKKNLQCKKVIDFLEVVTDDEVLSLIAKKLIEKL